MSNTSNVVVFSLFGLNETTNYRTVVFSLTLLCYCVILVVNVFLILTIILDENLHEPMYIFLCGLCINGLYGTTGFYPKFLFDLLSHTHVITYVGCLLQIFTIYSSATADFTILAVMAYDRYVAICRPLEYQSFMTKHRIAMLVCLSWLIPMICQVMVVTLTSTLELCGTRIEKLYCENWSVVKLACSTTTVNNVVGLIVVSFYLGHDVFIVCSYVQLIKSSLKSKEGRRKFMQTCVPHLLCLLNVTAALLFDVMYVRYGSKSVAQRIKNFMSIQFLMIPPIINPIIYGLKLTKIRKRIISLFMMMGQKFR
ncbi:olfactory receptor 10J5-like [Myripristis murdjan]|uniref:olfactory receptor 10J5-like n=1 Tax=Myripristis murdjan TaxID=586833 RepID=UPI0011761387|nr:olfactory receptor 10J5-like [Myripristis murdjan]